MNITDINFLGWPGEGIEAVIDEKPSLILLTKKYLLDLGIALVNDEDAERPYWAKVSYPLPADPTDGRGALNLQGGTNEPVIVCLARRYWLAVNDPNFTPGPVPVPTREEALAELNNPRAWKKGI